MNTVTVSQPPVPTYGYQYGPGLFNQQMAQAQAAGDTRYQAKEFDRAGMSRGKAQKATAANRGATQMAEGISQAYSQQAADAADINQRALRAAADQEAFALALAQLQASQQQQRAGILQGLL